MKNVLLVSDMVGVGKVALSTMIPILSAMKSDLSYLPTAMVSNNFSHGLADIFDMTESMRGTVDTWDKLGFEFDIITTGIIMSPEQVDIIIDLINNHNKKPLVIVDPIMGDNGTIYTGLATEIVDAMKKMVPFADILIPNATEAGLILDEVYEKGTMTEEKIKDWIERLRNKGAKSIAITSVNIDGEYYVYGYEDGKGIMKVKYEHIPMHFGGTGDVFSALVTGKISKGLGLNDSITYATEILTKMISEESKRNKDEVLEIQICNYLDLII